MALALDTSFSQMELSIDCDGISIQTGNHHLGKTRENDVMQTTRPIYDEKSLLKLGGERFSTEDQPLKLRHEWLQEVIGREYANVQITPPREQNLFNEMLIYPWHQMRLSAIRSNQIEIQRLKQEPTQASQDAYFVVLLRSGSYKLSQADREVILKPGQLTIYDATRPHHIECPEPFSKVIVAIPRTYLRDRIPSIDKLMAVNMHNDSGIAAMTVHMISSTLQYLNKLNQFEFNELSEQTLNLLSLLLQNNHYEYSSISNSQCILLQRIKYCISINLHDPELNAEMISRSIGVSSRYINKLFRTENTSLMRYVLNQRLEKCRSDLVRASNRKFSVSEIAYKWGFNNTAHFSRSFKACFGVTPSDYRQL